MKGEIMGIFDVAQIAIWLFWIFFAYLILYLRREDRREGYPLFQEPENRQKGDDWYFIPPPKTFRLANGETVEAPRKENDNARDHKMKKVEPWPGAPFEPVGDPMTAAVGPGAYAERKNVPEFTLHGQPVIVPMRAAGAGFFIPGEDPDPRGMSVIGADGVTAGTVKDVWIDRSEVIIRYLEVALNGMARSVLLPMTFATVNGRRKRIEVSAILGGQFAGVPALASDQQITKLEEDKVTAYFGAGTLYATRDRSESLL
ncbi:MAG: photosynthetic reaction center subunit H [Hyphomicrobium sp.]|nr:photosynthetic reaction center subunit H [Hyphomicrobium sp.]